jgi:hypothetical protein
MRMKGQLGGGGLVPGDQRCDQFVADLHRGHRAAVLVAGGQQHRQHVGALTGAVLSALTGAVSSALALALARARASPGALPSAGTRAPLGDQLADQLVGPGHRRLKALLGPRPAEVLAHRRDERQGVLGEAQQRGDDLTQVIELAALLEPEHCAEDDLQGQALEQRVQPGDLPGRPAVELGLGEL